MQYVEGTVFDGRFLLKKFKGSGSFGEVWLAVDQQTGIEVAIKIYIAMDPQGLEDFIKEFRISFNFNHPNLLHANYLEICRDDNNRPYLVMPYCPQGSASKYIGNITEEVLWVFIRDVAAGLAYLHSQEPPIIHQDIKPDNILIGPSGDFMITDFGISKQVRSTLRKSAAQVGSSGTIAYMGPEHFVNGYSAIKASDIWALGATIYELAMGDLPFCGYGGSMLNHGADMAELPEPDFSHELNKIMQLCLSKETWTRPAADQLAEYAAMKVKGKNPEPLWPEEQPAPVAESTEAAPQECEQPSISSKPVKKSNGALSWIVAAVLGLAAGAVASLCVGGMLF